MESPALLKLVFCRRELAQLLLPLCFQVACDQAVFWLHGAVAALSRVGFVLGAVDVVLPLDERRISIGFDFPFGPQGSFQTSGCDRVQKCVGHGSVNVHSANSQTPECFPVDQRVAGAVVAGRRALPLVVHEQLAPTVPTAGQSLQQRRSLSDSPTRLMRARAGVARDTRLVHLIGLPVDETLVMIADEYLPFGERQAPDPLAHLSVAADVAFMPRSPVQVYPCIHRAVEYGMDRMVGRCDPPNLGAGVRSRREEQPLRPEPDPHLSDRTHLGELLEDHADRRPHRLVWIKKDLAVLLAPDEPDRQSTLQLPARGLVPDASVQTRAQDV
jgi:hypothetical protein